MKNFFTKNWQSGQKIKRRFLLSFIASVSMMYLQAQCPAVNVPYTEGFESAVTPTLPDCTSFYVLAGPGSVGTCSGNENGFTGKFLCFRNNPNETFTMMRLMFQTRELNLVANTTYKISYDYGSNVFNDKQLSVSVEGSQGITFLGSHEVNVGRSSISKTFTAQYAGIYRFNFIADQQPQAAASEFILNVDNITVEPITSTPAPIITNFTSTASCAESTLLTINGTNLANATLKIAGISIPLATNTASQITANISTDIPEGFVVVTTLAGTTSAQGSFKFTVAPAIVLSAVTSTMCAGTASSPVTITTGASDYTAYNWTPSTGVTGNSTSGWIFNPTMSTSYVLNASNSTTACTSNLNYAVEITSSPVAGASLTGNVTITATPAGQTYQWINCTTNAPVAVVTGSIFNVAANGSYKVVVTNANGCKDTSDCVNVSKVGLAENSVDLGISLYPNPVEGNVYVAMTETEAAAVTVLDAQGKVVLTMNNIHNGTVIDMNNNQKGIYLVKVSNAKGTNVFRIVKK